MKKYEILLIISLFVVAIIIALFINQFIFVEKAHSTFDNYYAFRGCTQLVQKTDTYGICKTDSGQIIKIVVFRGRWYLDGDLPNCLWNYCW